MDISTAVAESVRTRELYRQLERRRYPREWDLRDLFIGLQGDLGRLAQLLGAREGVRPGPADLDAAVSHEIADCIWSLFVIADECDVDVETALVDLFAELTGRVTAKLAEPA